MARMLPPEVREDVKSNAERRLFGIIGTQLNAEWTALHSLGLTGHRTKPWAEADFVLIGPPGVFCLEVKGGRVGRYDGRWHFTNRQGTTTTKDQGPFEQVGGASAALRRHLLDKHPHLRDYAFGYGVLTPDIVWKIEGPDILPEVVYDERDERKSFPSYMRRLATYWQDRLEQQRSTPLATMTERECRLVVDELRGDFDLRPSLSTRVRHTDEQLLQLTKQQYRILDALYDNPRVLVRGGAGTGKTLLAVEEARRQAADGKKVFLCCYNRNLGRLLRLAVTDFGEDAVNVYACNLHAFMASIVREANLEQRLPDAEPSDLFDVFYPELSVEALMDLNRLQSYDVLIVDEAQDLLLSSHLEVFDALLKGGLDGGVWRLFSDPFQDIFLKTAASSSTRIEECHPARYKLDINCRNSEEIAVAAQILSGIHSPETLPVTGPDVEHIWVRDAAHGARETSNLIRKLLSEGLRPKDVTVLSPLTRGNSPTVAGITESRLSPVETESLDLERVRFSTIGAFKGLESKAVILCDITQWDEDAELFALYVGATRAVAYLAIVCSESLISSYKLKAVNYGRRLAETRLQRSQD